MSDTSDDIAPGRTSADRGTLISLEESAWRARLAALPHAAVRRSYRSWARALAPFLETPLANSDALPDGLLRSDGTLFPDSERALQVYFAMQWAASARILGEFSVLGRTHDLAEGTRVDGRATLRCLVTDLPFPMEFVGESAVTTVPPLEDIERWQRAFHRTVPRVLRRTLGQFHTPEWLVTDVLGELDEGLRLRGRILDPGCGSGVFVRLLLRERLERGMAPDEALQGLYGIEVDPLAVLIARFSITLEFLRQGVTPPSDVPSPIHWGDAVLGASFGAERNALPKVEALVGNPPWVGWDVLSRDYRDRLRKRVLDRLDLYESEGFLSRLGGASDDLLHVFTSVTIDRHLARDGQVLYLVKRSLFDNVTGRDFRRLRLRRRAGSSRSLAVLHVQDLSGLGKIFDDGAGATALLHLVADRATSFPIPWDERVDRDGTMRRGHAQPARDEEGAPWRIVWDDGECAPDLEGENAYAARIRHGLKHDAEDVFALEVVERSGDLVICRDETGTFEIESDLVFPYLKSRHVRAFSILGHGHVLLPQQRAGMDNEAWLREHRPCAYTYLRRHAGRLAQRRSSVYRKGVFYGLFGLGEYSFAPWRVAWCSMGEDPRFVVSGSREDAFLGPRAPIFDSVHYTIAFESDDAPHYLAAYLNAAPVRERLKANGGRSKRRFSKRALSTVRVPAFDAENACHQALVRFSREAHARAPGTPFDEVELGRLVRSIVS